MKHNANIIHVHSETKRLLCFEKLYSNMSDAIKKYAYYLTRSKADSEDTVHDIFLAVWQRWPYLQELGIEEIKAYLIKATKNRIINSKKKESHLKKDRLSDFSYIHDDIIFKEGMRAFSGGLKQLPEKRKMVFVLRYDGYNQKEIAQLLNISEHTVKNHVNLSLKTIRKHLQRKFEIAIEEDGRCYRYN